MVVSNAVYTVICYTFTSFELMELVCVNSLIPLTSSILIITRA
jgi:hypothetical protein